MNTRSLVPPAVAELPTVLPCASYTYKSKSSSSLGQEIRTSTPPRFASQCEVSMSALRSKWSQRSSPGTEQTAWADLASGTLDEPLAYSLPVQPVFVWSRDTVPLFGSAAPAVMASTAPAASTIASSTAKPGTGWERLNMATPCRLFAQGEAYPERVRRNPGCGAGSSSPPRRSAPARLPT